MVSEEQLRNDMVEIGRRLWLKSFVAANDGNITVRVGPDEFLTTPAGVSKGFMTPEMIVKVNGRGEPVTGNLKPSSEIKMHLLVYRERPDVRAVVHAHPPVCTAFAVAGLTHLQPTLPEVILTLGRIPLADYATPSTEEVPQAIAKYVKNHDAILLANHGALTCGSDVYAAYYNMERVEHFAKISLAARQLGEVHQLSEERIKQLVEVRQKMNLPGVYPGF